MVVPRTVAWVGLGIVLAPGVMWLGATIVGTLIGESAAENKPFPPSSGAKQLATYAPPGKAIYWLGDSYPTLVVETRSFTTGPGRWVDIGQRCPLRSGGTVFVDVITYLRGPSTYAPHGTRLLAELSRGGETVAVFITDYTGEPAQDEALRARLTAALTAVPRDTGS